MVICVLCDRSYKSITPAHLAAKHPKYTYDDYMALNGAANGNSTKRRLTCKVCKGVFYRKRKHKDFKCTKCSRKLYNERRNAKRLMNPASSVTLRKARFSLTLSESEKRMLGVGAENYGDDSNNPHKRELSLNHVMWDFVPGKRGGRASKGSRNIGFEKIGTLTTDDFKIVMVDGVQRLKGRLNNGKK